jgi:prepilin-type processing-associated H-X9-DG protein
MMPVRRQTTNGESRRSAACRARDRRSPGAFTLLELLVVTAIIALLTSLLLPTLRFVKESARDAICKSNEKQIAQAHATYMLEHDDQVVSPVTVGWERAMGGYGDEILPTTVWDTFSSLLPYLSYEPGSTRNDRLRQTVTGVFHCPSNARVSVPWCGEGDDPGGMLGRDGVPGILELGVLPAMSYGVPATMIVAGPGHSQAIYDQMGVDGLPFCQPRAPGGESSGPLAGVALPDAYFPTGEKIGLAANKIYLADATRYVTVAGQIITDVGLAGRGHFVSDGGWTRASHEYSEVREPGGGQAFLLSYRHIDGKGLNVAFFDGHVARLSREASHYAGNWMPTRTRIVEDRGLVDPNDPAQRRYYLGPGDFVP